MFSINSFILEKKLGLPTVNLGVNAGLGLPVILEKTLDVVESGDVVIIPLEYPLYSYDGDINQVMRDYYLSSPMAYYQAMRLVRASLPRWQFVKVVAKELFQIFMQTPLKRVIQGYAGLPDDFTVTGTYGPHHLDSRGDQTHSSIAEREIWMKQGVAQLPARSYGASFSPQAPGWAMLQHFQSQVRKRGACLLFVPPAFRFDPLYQENPTEHAFYKKLPSIARHHGLAFVGEPFDFMYGDGAMFDTDYHLVSEARDANTRRLLAVLTKGVSTPEPEETLGKLVCRTHQAI